MTTASAIETVRFEVGEIYYGTLACAHSDFPVRCTKRTAKSVWFEHVTCPQGYKPACVRVRDWGAHETAMFRRWYISSTKRTGGDFDPMTI